MTEQLLRAWLYVWGASPARLLTRIALTAFAAVTPVAVAWLTKTVLDRLAQAGADPLAGLLLPVLALAVVGVAFSMLPQLNRYVENQLSRLATLAAKERLYRSVGRMAGLARFESPEFHDRLQMAGGGTSGPSDLANSGLGIAQGALTIAGFLGTLWVLNPWMVLVVAVAAIPTLRAELLLSRSREHTMRELSGSSRRELFYANLLTSVRAIKEIRIFGLGDLFGQRMLTELRSIGERQRRTDIRELSVQALFAVAGAVVAGGGLVWAVVAAREGRLTIGDVSVFVAAVAGVQGALGILIDAIGRGHYALLMFSHYCFIVDAGPDLRPPPSDRAVPVEPLRHGIELRDVWFRYGDDLPWVLAGVNLAIPAGQATALVGLNGAGKSTLVKLLCRFYDPTRGSVRWDGTDLRDLPVEEVRRRISVVFQDFMEYDLTAAENIGVGDVSVLDEHGLDEHGLDEPGPASRERVTASARLAGCDPFLRDLPHGYDTMLTRIFVNSADRADPSTGVVLSGGQWQRVALARALMRTHGDLLVLDEPSAGLDAEAEHEIHQRLREFRAGRTSLLISHRLSTIRDADTIVVLSDGAILERGGHDELICAGGRYAELFGMQAAGYRDGVTAP